MRLGDSLKLIINFKEFFIFFSNVNYLIDKKLNF